MDVLAIPLRQRQVQLKIFAVRWCYLQLDGAMCPGCPDTDGGDVGASTNPLLCMGDTYLLNYGLGERPYIPEYSIWFLLLVTFLSIVASLLFGNH